MYKIKRFFNKIFKILCYIPVLWNDEDWDYSYILVLLRYKLERVKDTIHSNNIITKNDIRDITIGINQTIDHIDNHLNSYEKFKELYGDCPIDTKHTSKKCEDGLYQLLTLNKATGKPLTQEEEQIYYDYIKAQFEFEQKEWDAIFDTIKAEGMKWWD